MKKTEIKRIEIKKLGRKPFKVAAGRKPFRVAFWAVKPFLLFAIRYLLFAICYSLFAISCLYAFYEPGISARSLAMGSGGVASEKNVYLNPASIALSKDVVINANYRKFLLGASVERGIPGYIPPEIDEKTLFFAVPLSGVWGGFSISNFSLLNTYSQSIFSLYVGSDLKGLIYLDSDGFENILMGISFKYISMRYSSDEYSADFFNRYSKEVGGFTGDIGVLYKKENFCLGIAVKNFYPARVGIYDDTKLQPKILLGVSREISIFKVNLDVHWDSNIKKYDLSPAVEADIGTIKLRLGGNSHQLTNGIGVTVGNLEIDLTFLYPYQMQGGFVDVAFGLSYKFKTGLRIKN